eukprot:snap_masked-scaffold220_size252247-processed-gene-0.1 protein:Tk01510 transcript:snap_masked-scaffold220_size252247-processed-gene-0.1-mRNA-1 annotation:"casp1_spofr ame: full"
MKGLLGGRCALGSIWIPTETIQIIKYEHRGISVDTFLQDVAPLLGQPGQGPPPNLPVSQTEAVPYANFVVASSKFPADPAPICCWANRRWTRPTVGVTESASGLSVQSRGEKSGEDIAVDLAGQVVMDPLIAAAEVPVIAPRHVSPLTSSGSEAIITSDLVHTVRANSLTALADLINSHHITTTTNIHTDLFSECEHTCEVMPRRSESMESASQVTAPPVAAPLAAQPLYANVPLVATPVAVQALYPNVPEVDGAIHGRDVPDAQGIIDPEVIPNDEGDALGFGRSSRSVPANMARMPVEKDSETYNMNHKRRGVAFIFNHMNFDHRLSLKERNGTYADGDNLKATLRRLGFEVRPFNDLPFKEIDRLLEECSIEDHTDADCLWISVLSHGEQGILYANDHAYKPDRLWSHFSADRCRTLAGKPKLFFIQACQGDQLDGGIHLRKCSTTETDSSALSYKIPSHADFLIGYSTIPGFYSWRNVTAGSWFIQALCQVLAKEAGSKDLLSILTRVARKVAFDFQSNTPGSPMMHERKQIPCITSMLTRDVYFLRKNVYTTKPGPAQVSPARMGFHTEASSILRELIIIRSLSPIELHHGSFKRMQLG